MKIALILHLHLAFYAVRIFPSSGQSSCDYTPTYLGLTTVNEQQPVGTVLFNYTMFTSNDIVSVSNNYQNEFFFNTTSKQLIALIVFNAKVQPYYSLSLRMTCKNGAATFTQPIAINDVNNYPAVWIYGGTETLYSGTIKENSGNNTVVSFDNRNQPNFTDLDTNGVYNVQLLDPLGQNAFYISAKAINNPVIIANLILLSYNARSIYNLTLFLMDLDAKTNYPRFNSTASLIITVIDTDSSPPIFISNYYQFQIYSNATLNSPFNVLPQAIRAYDGNFNFNTSINYKLSTNFSYLNLEPTTGILRFVNSTTPITFNTNIIGYKINNNSVQSSVNVQIAIIDVNTLISVKFSQRFVNVSIAETFVGTLIKLNVSYNPSKSLQFSMQPSQLNFQILSTGLVIVVQRFYYQITNYYNFTIIASDSSTSDEMILQVYILNINEIQPVFSANTYYFRGYMTLAINTYAIEVKSYDTDASLTFQLYDLYGICNTTNSTNYFYISVVTTPKVQAVIYNVIVSVTESGQPPLTNSVNVSVDFTNTGLLPLYILLPIILILIILLPIILCYYKNRRVYKATGSSLGSSIRNESANSCYKRSGKSAELYENVYDVSDIYYSHSNFRQLSKEFKGSSTEKFSVKMKEVPISLDILEIKEIVQLPSKDYICDDEKVLKL